MKHTILNIILALIATYSWARVTDIDSVEGRLLQIQNVGTDECGVQTMLLVKTESGLRYIEGHSKDGLESKYILFLSKRVKIIYSESVGGQDCQAGIKSIKELK